MCEPVAQGYSVTPVAAPREQDVGRMPRMMATMIVLGSLLSTTACSNDRSRDGGATADHIAGTAVITAISPSLTRAQQDKQHTPTITAPTRDQGATAAPAVSAPTRQVVTATPEDRASASYGFTHQRADGNRMVAGRGSVPAARVVDVPIGGTPAWIVAAPHPRGVIWVTVLADGTAHAFRTVGAEVEHIPVIPNRLPPGMPPLVQVTADTVTLVEAEGIASPLTHPVPAGDRLLWVTPEGDVAFSGSGDRRLAAQALPDARLVSDGTGLVAVLGGATQERYRHGVLGDAIEATQLVLLAAEPALRIVRVIGLSAPDVVEGIAPIWADLDGDGTRELVVTVSNSTIGGRIVIYGTDGRRMAEGPGFDHSGRWRQAIAVGPFATNGTQELAVVRAPHIGGVVEFYQLLDAELRLTASLPGYTSHVLGSRNLDMAVAGDFDGDGQMELLLPVQDRTMLAGIQRTTTGAAQAWTVGVGGVAATNLAAVTLPDGLLALGVGREDGTVRLWLPR